MTDVERLDGKVAVVVGAGQTEGATVGNGRATAIVLARAGVKVLAVDRNLDSAEETAQLIASEGGEALAGRVDVTVEDDLASMASVAVERWGRIDILHNNVGVSVLSGDAPVTEINASALSRLMAINVEGMILACKHVLPVMRRQESGVITNVSSNAALIDYPYVAYKTSKAGVVAFTQHLAIRNAEYGIRANTILPGLMETPMAVEYRIGEESTREEVLAARQARIPLKGRAGTAWDVANATRFLVSDAASFITGVALVIDGGQSLRIG
jgi:NAD(P)-dependent dehydrogenase (short-subunit alcohol dehydrogenase family)